MEVVKVIFIHVGLAIAVFTSIFLLGKFLLVALMVGAPLVAGVLLWIAVKDLIGEVKSMQRMKNKPWNHSKEP